ncbi:MAG: hypothetical protein KGM96_08475 [Acidobacteriota bacterium]|nr:hypothetical protein [Acidobacteriota bacterium]
MLAPLLARTIVTALAAGQGAAPLFIDLNRTHATHPLWPGHARFHVVWQTFTQALGSAAVVALLWWAGPGVSQRFYLAALFTALPLAGFLFALFARRLYAGTLHDPNGIAPVRIPLRSRAVELDMNLVLVGVASVLLVAAVLIF